MMLASLAVSRTSIAALALGVALLLTAHARAFGPGQGLVDRLPRQVEAAVLVTGADGLLASEAGLRLASALDEAGLLAQTERAWAELASALSLGEAEAVRALLGRRVLVAVGAEDDAARRDWAILSEVSRETAQSLRRNLKVAPRQIKGGVVVLSVEQGRFGLALSPERQNGLTLALLAPSGATGVFDSMLAILSERQPAMAGAAEGIDVYARADGPLQRVLAARPAGPAWRLELAVPAGWLGIDHRAASTIESWRPPAPLGPSAPGRLATAGVLEGRLMEKAQPPPGVQKRAPVAVVLGPERRRHVAWWVADIPKAAADLEADLAEPSRPRGAAELARAFPEAALTVRSSSRGAAWQLVWAGGGAGGWIVAEESSDGALDAFLSRRALEPGRWLSVGSGAVGACMVIAMDVGHGEAALATLARQIEFASWRAWLEDDRAARAEVDVTFAAPRGGAQQPAAKRSR